MYPGSHSQDESDFWRGYHACKDYGCVRAGVSSNGADKGLKAALPTNGTDLTERVKSVHSRQFIPGFPYLGLVVDCVA